MSTAYGNSQSDIRLVEKREITTTELIASADAYDVGTIISTSGFVSAGDGAGDEWVKTATTGTLSQTPLQLGAALLNTADGSQWGLVGADGISLNSLGATHTSDLGVYLTLAGDIIRAAFTADGAGLNTMPVRITLNNGAYTQTTSGNLQSMTSADWELDFTGSYIVGECTGKSMIDLLGSRFGTLMGVHLHGHITNTPAIGYQYGRLVATTPAGTLSFIKCKGSGHFSRANAYNLSSEVEYWEQLELNNHSVLADSYCHIWDGNNTWGAITDFAVPTMAQYTAMSNIQHTFDDPAWRKSFGGSALWMCRTQQWKSYNGYAVTDDAYAMVMSSDDFGFDDIHFDAHIENAGSLGAIQFVMNPAAAGTTCRVRGFTHIEHGAQWTNEVYRNDVTALELLDVDIQITRYQTPVPTAGLVSPSPGATISGKIYSGDAAVYKAFEFYGEISSPNAAAGNYGTGNYTIRDTVSGMVWFKGETRFIGRQAQTLAGANLLTQQYAEMNNGRLLQGGGAVVVIASGVITLPIAGFYKVDTEASAASDTLDTINGGDTGDVIVLKENDAGRVVTLGHATGNIKLLGAVSYAFASGNTYIQLMFDGMDWQQISPVSTNV